jgi:chromosome segregation ATPase
MDKSKQVEAIRKRNSELTKQLEDIRFELEFNSQLNTKGYQRAKDLIEELEQIKQDWTLALEDLNDKREKYSILIADLQKIKKIMTNMGFKIPWHKKIINKLRGL